MCDLKPQLLQLEKDGLRRQRRIVDGPQGAYLRVDGREYLSFCSNGYLGLANHPAVVAAARQGLDEYGIGAGASALICGHSRAHEELETKLAAFVRLPRAIHFSTGYLANLGIIPSLVGRGDTVFVDRLNHACLIDGARLSRAEFRVYPHLDLTTLERRLARCTSPRKLVASDAVFSMDGDIAPIPELLALCERYDAWLVLDDAHGFGVLGEQGRGSLAHFQIAYSPRIVYMGTLGKAAGVSGAFVAGAPDVIEWLLQRARTYAFTTASPPLLATALIASLELIATEAWRRDRIRELAHRLRVGVADLPWRLLPSGTAIQPLIVGDNRAAVDLMEALRRQAIWVPAIRPPTVPAGTARLRISLSAAHTSADVDLLIAALRERAGGLGQFSREPAQHAAGT
ncbi:MAG: 8-amino-7-oxononanoate synthase [Burkholderiales bacterium]